MQDTDMREKLVKLVAAYEELQAKMGDPAVLANQKEYNRLAKEYANPGPLVAKARPYVQAVDDLAEAKDAVASAKRNLFTAYRSYYWAVNYGVMTGNG